MASNTESILEKTEELAQFDFLLGESDLGNGERMRQLGQEADAVSLGHTEKAAKHAEPSRSRSYWKEKRHTEWKERAGQLGA